MNPHQVTKDFERALCAYTGAPYAVTTTSCTLALLLAVAWHLRNAWKPGQSCAHGECVNVERTPIEIPKRTYVSVPQSIIHAGGRTTFRDDDWGRWGFYQLKPLPVWDCARWFSGSMWNVFNPGDMVCVSFHWGKTLGIQQGGAILHDNPEADAWLRRARFDGRTEGVAPKDDVFDMIGFHAYMSPEVAAEGLMRLSLLPEKNSPIPMDDYPDLSALEIFK